MSGLFFFFFFMRSRVNLGWPVSFTAREFPFLGNRLFLLGSLSPSGAEISCLLISSRRSMFPLWHVVPPQFLKSFFGYVTISMGLKSESREKALIRFSFPKSQGSLPSTPSFSTAPKTRSLPCPHMFSFFLPGVMVPPFFSSPQGECFMVRQTAHPQDKEVTPPAGKFCFSFFSPRFSGSPFFEAGEEVSWKDRRFSLFSREVRRFLFSPKPFSSPFFQMTLPFRELDRQGRVLLHLLQRKFHFFCRE